MHTFDRYPSAPLARNFSWSPLRADAVRAMTLRSATCGFADLRMRTVVSRPSKPSIWWSIRTTSYAFFSTCSRASYPLETLSTLKPTG